MTTAAIRALFVAAAALLACAIWQAMADHVAAAIMLLCTALLAGAFAGILATGRR